MKHADWLVLARDGEMLLAAERLPKGDDVNPLAILYNELQGTSSEEKDLQVFFKWGNFEGVEPTPLGEMVGNGSKSLTGYDWQLEVVAPEASKGGPGSGNWGHGGLPGVWGGSSPGGGLGKVCRRPEGDEIAEGRQGHPGHKRCDEQGDPHDLLAHRSPIRAWRGQEQAGHRPG